MISSTPLSTSYQQNVLKRIQPAEFLDTEVNLLLWYVRI